MTKNSFINRPSVPKGRAESDQTCLVQGYHYFMMLHDETTQQ